MAGKAEARGQIDSVLRAATEAGEVPGVVAAATDANGPIYEGAFGKRSLDGGAAMTPDTIFRIASMTKAVTCVAAMQLVEAGRLALDEPVSDISPTLSAPQVLDGFDAAGKPVLRPAKRPITLTHLMTHTAGFTYEMWNADTGRYVRESGTLPLMSGKLAALDRPLMFDPGERWEYGINIDWIGRLIEAVSGQPLDVYMRDHIFAPLGMRDTGFMPSPEQRARQAQVHQRAADSSLAPQPFEPLGPREFYAGGGGLYSTAPDYLRFLQMLLHEGSHRGAQILRPETVALMHRNHIGELPAGVLKTAMPELTNDVDLFPGASLRWSLGHMLNLEAGPNGRSAGTLGWAGLFNSYYWLDPVRRVAGTIMTQILPFADPTVVRLYGQFERGVYALSEAA